MASDSRTLKLAILGEVKGLTDSLNKSTKDVQTFGDKLTKFGKVAGAAFLAAGAAAVAYAGKLAVDGVKAAIADEAAQTKLATTLKNVTGATQGTIKATEDYVLKTSLAFGITDEKLRPSLERLVRATKDVADAQKLQNLAIDISAGSGKSLEAVSNALGKAYEGNTGALGKLGVGLSSAELKSMSFDQVTKQLSNTFGGQAAANADTYQGRIERLKVAFDETKETIGFALLPILQTLLGFISDNILPIFTKVSDALNGSKGLNTYFINLGNTVKTILLPIFSGLQKAFGYIGDAIADNQEAFLKFGQFIEKYIAPVLGKVLGGALELVGKIAAGVITIIAKVIDGFTILINGAIEGINFLIKQYNKIPFLPNVSEIGGITLKAPKIDTKAILGSASTSAIGSVGAVMPTLPTSGGGTSSGASNSNQAALDNIAKLQKAVDKNVISANKALDLANAAIAKADAFLPISSADLNYQDSFRNNPMNTYNVTVNGAIDSESTARQIVTILNQSSARGTLGAAGFTTGAVGF